MSIILDALKKAQTTKEAPKPAAPVEPKIEQAASGMFNPQSFVAPQDMSAQKKRIIMLSAVAVVLLGIFTFVGTSSKIKSLFSKSPTETDVVTKTTPKIAAQENTAIKDDSVETKHKSDLDQLKLEALNKFKKQDYTQSAEDYKKIISKVADDPEAYNNYGLVLKKIGNIADAKQQYMIAITLNPDYPEALNNMAVLEIGESHYNEARERLEKAISLNPEYLDPYLHLAICLEKLGEVTKAVDYYQEFLMRSEGRGDLRDVRVQIESRVARLSEDM